jgi:pimeloyl-ACP methyl ester carboxylesterase
MAKEYPYDDSGKALYTPAKDVGFFESWDQRDTDNHALLCAEMSRLAYATDKETVTEALRTIGFTRKLWMGGETPAERMKTLGTDGFIATNEAGLAVLAFRGTEANKPEDLLADGFALPGPWVKSGQVDQGFARSYKAVREDINEVLTQHHGTLLVTGHSLGAALATLAAAEHVARTPTLITFGSPRVGDEAFASLLDGLKEQRKIHRFVDCCDLVTRVPPEQFHQSEIKELLMELVPDSVAGSVPVVATGLALALRLFGIQPQYVHVGDAKYRDRSGKTPPAGTTVADDQQAARLAYEGHVIPEPEDLLHSLRSAVTAAANAGGLRNAIRKFGAELFQGGRAPLRDLADHAPINYVSLFSGRIPPTGGS